MLLTETVQNQRIITTKGQRHH